MTDMANNIYAAALFFLLFLPSSESTNVIFQPIQEGRVARLGWSFSSIGDWDDMVHDNYTDISDIVDPVSVYIPCTDRSVVQTQSGRVDVSKTDADDCLSPFSKDRQTSRYEYETCLNLNERLHHR